MPTTASPFSSSAMVASSVTRVWSEMTCEPPKLVLPAGFTAARTMLLLDGGSLASHVAITSPRPLPASSNLAGITGTGLIDCTPPGGGKEAPFGREEYCTDVPVVQPTVAPPASSTLTPGPCATPGGEITVPGVFSAPNPPETVPLTSSMVGPTESRNATTTCPFGFDDTVWSV